MFFYIAETDDQYGWYKWDVKDANDIDEVCAVINQMEGVYTYTYNSDSSGSWYKRDKNGSIVTKHVASFRFNLSPTIIGGIITGCVVLIVGIALLLKPKKQKQQGADGAVYSGGVML